MTRSSTFAFDVAFWADDTGRIDYGAPSQTSVGWSPRVFNNNDQVLVVVPGVPEPEWQLRSPRTDARVPITSPGGETVEAVSLNDSGTVVGLIRLAVFLLEDTRPIIWDAGAGLRILTDLSALGQCLGQSRTDHRGQDRHRSEARWDSG